MTEGVIAVTPVASEPSPSEGPDIIGQLLRAQAEPSAVEVFADWHETESHRLEPTYRKLLPVSPPVEGEQYAFSVDLDACTACKACVSACHSLNGLEDGEMWRSVGSLVGGTTREPFRQTVTTACHHCLEPACMHGCPVHAYEKDPVTGIVRHLDDQCIGCRYCMLTCPYEVPKFSPSKGIVRKCDMCSDRLGEGEAPACVQGCPNDAISITVVSTRDVLDDLTIGNLVPGAPDPTLTLPSTQYVSRKVRPRNTRAVDLADVEPREGHPPLVVMLTLTQLSVGALALQSGWPLREEALTPFTTAIALLALAASTLHLGRPQWAFRAILGLRRSWLSREILAFGLFAGLAVSSVGLSWLGAPPAWQKILRILTVGMGLVGILTSAMIYKSTGRPTWKGLDTPLKFFATALILGAATHLLVGALAGAEGLQAPLTVLLAASSAKLLLELGSLRALAHRVESPHRAAARLLVGPLRSWLIPRWVLGSVAGVASPLFYLSSQMDPGAVSAVLLFVALLVAELIHAHLFFVAAAAPKMPGETR
ncbi:MAG: DmsC/YnfH family molybdoenzyme membrane anchor subunit [Myxococcota bacterium]